MKLNKKVFAGALALAMGLGVAAPAVNSFAANNTSGQELVTNDYRKAEEAFVAVFEKNQELKDSIPAKEKAVEEAEKAVKEANDMAAAKEFVEKHKDDTQKVDLTPEQKENSAIVEFNNLLDKKAAAKYDFDNSSDSENEDIKADAKEYLKATEEEKQEIRAKYKDDIKEFEKIVGYAQADNAATKAVEDYVEKIDKSEDKKDAAVKALKEAKDALAYAKGYDSSFEYKNAKQKFVSAGGDLEQINKAEKSGVYVPKEDEKDDLTEKIEASLKANKEKLSALKVVKEIMPESYKRYKKVIDEAVEAAEKAIKKAEDFLKNNKEKKTASLFTVAYASDATNEPTAEEVLKDLEDSEKKLDDAINQVEQDNKEKNEAEAEETETEENKEDKKEESKPEVTEKEDKTPSKNVKTGVAGVAGVGAVLAAASAAYVSSKRK